MKLKIVPTRDWHDGSPEVYPVLEFVACQEHFEDCLTCKNAQTFYGLPDSEKQYCEVGKKLFASWKLSQSGYCTACERQAILFLRKDANPICLCCLYAISRSEPPLVHMTVPGFDPRPPGLHPDGYFAAKAPGWPGQRDGRPLGSLRSRLL